MRSVASGVPTPLTSSAPPSRKFPCMMISSSSTDGNSPGANVQPNEPATVARTLPETTLRFCGEVGVVPGLG